MTGRAALVTLLWLFAAAGCDFGFEVAELPDRWLDASTGDGGGADGGCGTTTATIRIRGLAFSDIHAHVPAGTRVTWINEDTVVHDVTEGNPGDPVADFTSGALAPGMSWSRDFCVPEQLTYHCAAHASIMRDVVLVVEAP